MTDTYAIPFLDLSGPKRANYGVICTAQDTKTGRQTSFRAIGPLRDAMRDVAAQVDALGEGWKITALSSPPSIFRDLQGTRAQVLSSDSVMHVRWSDPRSNEVVMLGLIDRLDLLAPLRHLPADG